jgi:hypothetical protein
VYYLKYNNVLKAKLTQNLKTALNPDDRGDPFLRNDDEHAEG